jgi:serine protease Do
MKHYTFNVIITIIISSLISLSTLSLYHFFDRKNNLTPPSVWVETSTIKTSTITPSINESLANRQQQIVDNIANASESVVNIIVTKDLQVYFDNPLSFFGAWYVEKRPTQIWWWSGIFISKEWYIITNKHVVADPTSSYTVITKDGSTYEVTNIRLDNVIDIAILKIQPNSSSNIKPATFTNIEEKVQIWQFVFAIGNALSEYPNSVTMGIISAKNRQLEAESNNLYIWLYQTDTSINPGNSGWPLIDIQGRVIGINTAISRLGDGIWFALPVNKQFIEQTLTSIKQSDNIIRPFIGITYKDLTKQTAQELNIKQQKGAYIELVIPNSPAQKAWLQKGDVIIAINKSELSYDLPFLYQLYTYAPWSTINLTVVRNNQNIIIPITLGMQ